MIQKINNIIMRTPITDDSPVLCLFDSKHDINQYNFVIPSNCSQDKLIEYSAYYNVIKFTFHNQECIMFKNTYFQYWTGCIKINLIKEGDEVYDFDDYKDIFMCLNIFPRDLDNMIISYVDYKECLLLPQILEILNLSKYNNNKELITEIEKLLQKYSFLVWTPLCKCKFSMNCTCESIIRYNSDVKQISKIIINEIYNYNLKVIKNRYHGLIIRLEHINEFHYVKISNMSNILDTILEIYTILYIIDYITSKLENNKCNIDTIKHIIEMIIGLSTY